MFITKKKFEQAIKEAQEKAFCEADKNRWQYEETQSLRRAIEDLEARVQEIENKGKKVSRCPCMVFPRKW